MKIIIVCALTLCVLAACNKENSQQGVTEDATSATPTTAVSKPEPQKIQPVAAPEGERGMEELAARGIEVDFPHAVLYDILDVSDSGKRRHRILLEVEGESFEDAASRFGDALEANGFTKKSDTESEGRLDQVFVKPGVSSFYLIMQPAGMGPELTKPESVGSIHIMWNI